MNKITLDSNFNHKLEIRKKQSHKNSYGKTLIIAGSKNMMGACILSSKSAYKSGCGLVKILTEDINTNCLFSSIPEAIVNTYTRFDCNNENFLIQDILWADSILIGPGLSMDDYSIYLLKMVLQHAKCKIVIDADGLNALSQNLDLLKNLNKDIIITPHIGEMSRLVDLNNNEVLKNKEEIALNFSNENKLITVLKSHETIISNGHDVYLNTFGNAGMATAGSGDVLAGIIASLCAQGLNVLDASKKGVVIHSKAGDLAKEKYGEHSLMASDIIEFISDVLK